MGGEEGQGRVGQQDNPSFVFSVHRCVVASSFFYISLAHLCAGFRVKLLIVCVFVILSALCGYSFTTPATLTPPSLHSTVPSAVAPNLHCSTVEKVV